MNGEFSSNDKKVQLYLSQCKTLKTLLEHKAITEKQYEKSFNDLTDKMGMREYVDKV